MKTILAIFTAAVLSSSFAFAQDKDKASKKKSEGAKTVTVKLSQQNKSKESGTARLTPAGDKTKVELNIKGAPKGVSQPAHIHEGSCAKLDPKPAFPLSPLVNGKSETIVNASIDDLTSGGYAINGHKSAQEVSTYVFCGDLKK